jgi:D-xylose transport system permease protein
MALVVACCAFMLDPEDGVGWSAVTAVPLALGVGVLFGAWQGVLVAHCRIPAFIVTLSGMFIFRGLTQRVSARDPRVPDASWVNALGFNYLPPVAGYIVAGIVSVTIILATVAAARRCRLLGLPSNGIPGILLRAGLPCALLIGFVWKVNAYRGLPAQTLVMAVVVSVMTFVACRTRFGRHVFAIGGNTEAARLSGINVERNTIAVFAIMGLLAGVAGVVWMAQNQGATQKAGEWYELYAIAACVIGGTSLMGGRGSVFGTLLGALVMATVIQGMDYTGLQNWIQLAVRGAVLALAVGIDVAGKDPAPWMLRLRRRITQR